ncbi:MAG: DUF1588 domain-containing protein [Lentisphaeraceae bacterium]|nr:DUF1588 domain-containing protein [Lentisphaeraceae bacterium]
MNTERKTVCHLCSEKIDVSEAIPFSKVSCNSCGGLILVTEVIGDYILTKQVLEDTHSISYKGFNDLGETLSVKKLKVENNYDEEQFRHLEEKLKTLNSESIDYKLLKLGDSYLVTRPWLQICVGSYLKEKRPKSEQASLFLHQLSQRFLKAAESKQAITSITLENVFLNDMGDVTIADRGYIETKHIDFKQSLLCFQNLTANPCCDTDFTVDMELNLALRDVAPENLKNFLKKLFSKDSFQSFDELNIATTSLIDNASIQTTHTKKTVEKKKPKKVSSNKKTKTFAAQKKPTTIQNKSRRIIRKNKNKGKSYLPLITILGLISAVAFAVLFSSKFKTNQTPVASVKTKAPKKVIPKKKKIVQAPKPKEIEVREIVSKPQEPEIINFTNDHQNFTKIIDKHCLDCHGKKEDEIEGKFNFVKFLASKKQNPKAWKIIYDQIKKGDMPPEDQEPLTLEEKMIVLNEIEKTTSETKITKQMRPLTPVEIKNSIVDLFHIEKGSYNPFDALYANYTDDKFHSMQTEVITPFYMSDLYEILHDSIESFVSLNPIVKPMNMSASFPPAAVSQRVFKDGSHLRWIGEHVAVNFKKHDLPKPKPKTKNREKVGPTSNIDEALRNLTLPPGTYKLSFTAQAMNMDTYNIDQYKWGKEVVDYIKGFLKKHPYSVPVRFFTKPPGTADPYAKSNPITTLDIGSSEPSKYTVEFTLSRRNGIGYISDVLPAVGTLIKLIVPHMFKGQKIDITHFEKVSAMLYTHKYVFPQVHFKDIEITGPYDVKVSDYSVNREMERLDNITIRKKFRALHNDNFIQNNIPYDYIFSKFKQRGIEKGESFRNSLVAFFLSPDFLTLEYDRKDKRKQARMISYSFHKTFPKKEMMDQLNDRDGIRRGKFTEWLVQNEGFEEFIEDFAYQWLNMAAIKEAMPDQNRFSEFYSNKLLKDFTLEIRHFITHLFKENRPVNELISADYSIINSNLASFYGSSSSSKEFLKTDLKESSRGGLLSTGAFLTATGNGLEGLPIRRAQWILENVLDSNLPPPPDNIDVENFEKAAGKSLKERLKIHSSHPQCYACHKKIDPLALVMDSFSTIGRENYRHISTEYNGIPLKGFKDLKKYLGSQDEAIARSLIKNILKYTLGRELYVQDGLIIDRIIEKHAADNFPVRDLLDSMIKGFFL